MNIDELRDQVALIRAITELAKSKVRAVSVVVYLPGGNRVEYMMRDVSGVGLALWEDEKWLNSEIQRLQDDLPFI